MMSVYLLGRPPLFPWGRDSCGFAVLLPTLFRPHNPIFLSARDRG